MMGCPHKDIRYCPLYHAAHIVGAGGCDDGRLDEGGCAVDRKLNYNKAIAKLHKKHPEIIEDCADREWRAESEAQVKRNMRAAGLH